ncbi:Hypothetical protein IALB_2470 [Ignavibacterium album JCM 16511]|uniref:Uncharacterized protein n=1 Tax=Ignavibacterium album (strain DSM 19864 / JCM 16511 / NBRC 101810 / Mat9-16) TaxID=945713 RepID=I0AMG6_IGNAJ|nr:Hypothetical protein IALB_2470 [Ignavibacterium album JCM 16511]
MNRNPEGMILLIDVVFIGLHKIRYLIISPPLGFWSVVDVHSCYNNFSPA